jgi:hypothetical protein
MVAHDLPADDELGGRRNRIAANHLSLIRSFLPESDAFRRSRAVICAKIFNTQPSMLQAPPTQNAAIKIRKFFFEIVRRTNYRR